MAQLTSVKHQIKQLSLFWSLLLNKWQIWKADAPYKGMWLAMTHSLLKPSKNTVFMAPLPKFRAFLGFFMTNSKFSTFLKPVVKFGASLRLVQTLGHLSYLASC